MYYSKQDFLVEGKKYEVIIVVNGNRPLRQYKKVLKPHGLLVVVGGSISQVLKTLIFGKLLSLGGKRVTLLSAKPNTKDLEFIVKLVEDGSIKPVIDRQYPLEKTAEAMNYLKQGHAQGKVVISVA